MSKATVGNILLDKEILLESGTNELEVLVFRIGEQTFGINVAKVREVFPRTKITRLAKSHPSIRGVFKLRDEVIPCVSLVDHLKITPSADAAEGTMILTDFNCQQTAFLVDHVERIHRLSWENILAVPSILETTGAPVTAITRIGERLITMLDFETIIDQVTDKQHRAGIVENPLGLPRETLRLVLADDSSTVRMAVGKTLRESGYTDLHVFENGKAAWEWLEAHATKAKTSHEVVDLVISDVEMPLIDGFHLTKKIKEHSLLGTTPVMLYSSIVTPENHNKGEAVGADAQVAKPDLAKVVALADSLIVRNRPELAESTDTPCDSSTQQATPARIAQAVEQDAAATTNNLLWATFRDELMQKVQLVKTLLEIPAESDGETAQQALRVLHTIKAAAMVIPIGSVTRVTHAVEDILATVHDGTSAFPTDDLERYVGWLEEVAECRTPDAAERMEEEWTAAPAACCNR